MEKITIEAADKMITLLFEQFDTDIDIDSLINIDYSNLLGEILTFPVVFNRIGLLRAEMKSQVSEKKFELEVYEAEMNEHYRKALMTSTSKVVKGNLVATAKSATIDQINSAVIKDAGYQNKYKQYLRACRNLEYVDALYWAAKSKDGKLDKLIERAVTPQEFEQGIAEGTFNTVRIKLSKKFIN